VKDAALYIADKAWNFTVLGFLVLATLAVPQLIGG